MVAWRFRKSNLVPRWFRWRPSLASVSCWWKNNVSEWKKNYKLLRQSEILSLPQQADKEKFILLSFWWECTSTVYTLSLASLEIICVTRNFYSARIYSTIALHILPFQTLACLPTIWSEPSTSVSWVRTRIISGGYDPFCSSGVTV